MINQIKQFELKFKDLSEKAKSTFSEIDFDKKVINKDKEIVISWTAYIRIKSFFYYYDCFKLYFEDEYDIGGTSLSFSEIISKFIDESELSLKIIQEFKEEEEYKYIVNEINKSILASDLLDIHSDAIKGTYFIDKEILDHIDSLERLTNSFIKFLKGDEK